MSKKINNIKKAIKDEINQYLANGSIEPYSGPRSAEEKNQSYTENTWVSHE